MLPLMLKEATFLETVMHKREPYARGNCDQQLFLCTFAQSAQGYIYPSLLSRIFAERCSCGRRIVAINGTLVYYNKQRTFWKANPPSLVSKVNFWKLKLRSPITAAGEIRMACACLTMACRVYFCWILQNQFSQINGLKAAWIKKEPFSRLQKVLHSLPTPCRTKAGSVGV